MPRTLTMTFRRADYRGAACLEYSWVPEGKRRTLILAPGVRELANADSVSGAASHVQVYVLNNNNRASTEMWQFPPGPPRPHELTAALIDVRAPLEAIGTAFYAGGPSASDVRQLDDYGRKCPAELGN